MTAAAAGVALLLIAAMLAASQFVRFGIPGWQLAERDRGEEGQPVVLSEARNGDHGFFLYQEGSSLRYTYYENEPGLDFGYHFRASGTGHEETGVYVVQHRETLLVVSLNRVEEVEGIEVTDPESGTVRQTYPVPRGALRGAGDSGRRGGGLGPPGSGAAGGRPFPLRTTTCGERERNRRKSRGRTIQNVLSCPCFTDLDRDWVLRCPDRPSSRPRFSADPGRSR